MKVFRLFVPVLLCFLFFSCSPEEKTISNTQEPRVVVALTSSLAEIWLLSGGEVAATTSDAFDEHRIGVDASCINLGSVKNPNMEQILALDPDLVLLSPLLSSHRSIEVHLASYQIPCISFNLDTPQNYLEALSWCCNRTGNKEAYQSNGTAMLARIEKIISDFQGDSHARVLLVRSHSTKVKALNENSQVGAMLKALSVDTIASKYPSLLDQLSWEIILKENPTLILVVPMGDVTVAEAQMHHMIQENPILGEVEAVKQGNVHLLSKELFAYKPNHRWSESYAYLVSLLRQ
ncbi:MAG: ABC transporter substrate-binding protein [Sphaerochaeta sp.]